MYVVCILDVFSRKVLAHEISNTLDTSSCIQCLDKAVARYGIPVIFNSDQGTQFTSHAWVGKLQEYGIHGW